MQPLVIGFAGVSGAGKSTLVKRLVARGNAVRFRLDAFYKDEADCPREGEWVNWELPESLALAEAWQALVAIARGEAVKMPVYDRKTNRRIGFERLVPERYVLAEGMHLFTDPSLRNLLHLSIWVDTPPELALKRRRHRQPAYNMAYHEAIHAPAMARYVEPCRAHADIVLDGQLNEEDLLASASAMIEAHVPHAYARQQAGA
jgi:uridine kinase